MAMKIGKDEHGTGFYGPSPQKRLIHHFYHIITHVFFLILIEMLHFFCTEVQGKSFPSILD